MIRRSVLEVLSIVCVCFVGPQATAADAPQTLPMDAAPLVYERDGMVQGCGVRITGGEPGGTAPSSWFDVSFNVFRRGIALAQSYAYEMRPSAYDADSRPARVPVQSTWLAVADGMVRRGENTEQRDSLVYALVVDDALSLFQALAEGRPLRLGIKRWGERYDSVYSGSPALSGETRDRIGDCLASLSADPGASR